MYPALNLFDGPRFYPSPPYVGKRWPLATASWPKPMPVSRRQPHAWATPHWRRPVPEPCALFDWSAPWAALPELDRTYLPFYSASRPADVAAPVPPSPTDTSSSAASDRSAPSPHPSVPQLVICNAPLVAPRPLPYHSPTFLQFDLPDDDEDLSHPPYTKRAPKRKREDAESPDQPPQQRQKLRIVVPNHPAPLPFSRRRHPQHHK